MTTASILLVEDDSSIVDIVTQSLKKSGYRVNAAFSVAQAQEYLQQEKPDLLLLDWMLPDQEGIVFFRQLRANHQYRDMPVIILTARNTPQDQACILDQGVDDFIGKPFSQEVLLARVRSVIRRSMGSNTLMYADMVFDTRSRHVNHKNASVQLFPLEAQLLAVFFRKPGHVFSREQLMALLHSASQVVEVRTIDVHISRLRRQLQRIDCHCIRTVRGSGYMLEQITS